MVVELQRFADGVDRVTRVDEPYLDGADALRLQPLFTLPSSGGGWQFGGVTPRFFAALAQRGFQPDPAVLG